MKALHLIKSGKTKVNKAGWLCLTPLICKEHGNTRLRLTVAEGDLMELRGERGEQDAEGED